MIETSDSGEERRLDVRGAGQDFGVARLRYELRQDDGGYFGVGSFSGGVSHPQESAFVQGVDLHYLSPGGLWKADGQVIYSDTDSHGRGSAAHGEMVRNPGSGVRHVFAFGYMDDSFDLNDIGYHRRNDYLVGEWRRNSRTVGPSKVSSIGDNHGCFSALEWRRRPYSLRLLLFARNGVARSEGSRVEHPRSPRRPTRIGTRAEMGSIRRKRDSIWMGRLALIDPGHSRASCMPRLAAKSLEACTFNWALS